MTVKRAIAPASCTQCNRVDKQGTAKVKVWEVEVEHTIIRLCSDCLAELADMIDDCIGGGR